MKVAGDGLVIIGENFNATRKIKITSPKVVQKDGKVGIGASAPSERLTVAGNIAPASDNAYSFGTASRRASAIYAATGVINGLSFNF